MALYHETLGWGPWSVYRQEPPGLTDMRYRGSPAEFSFLVAGTSIPGMPNFWLCQPLEGPSLYRDLVEEEDPGATLHDDLAQDGGRERCAECVAARRRCDRADGRPGRRARSSSLSTTRATASASSSRPAAVGRPTSDRWAPIPSPQPPMSHAAGTPIVEARGVGEAVRGHPGPPRHRPYVFSGARSTRSSVRTAPANRRSSRSSPASTPPTGARSRWTASR